MANLLSAIRSLWRFIKSFVKDFIPAYKILFNKSKNNSPFKIRLSNRAGGNSYHQSFIRMFFTLIIMGFALGVFSVFVSVTIGVLTTKTISLFTLLSPLCVILLAPVLMYQHDNYSLGYWGERAVGEELDKLGRTQWYIFHSFDAIGKGDIDHIIVCPKGVFCVETKTLRQRESDTKLVFKDDSLWRGNIKLNNPDPINQARRNSAMLNNYLKDKCGESGFIASIVAFPNHSITIEHGHYNKDVIPCQPKSIGGIFSNREDKLSAKQIEKICAVLEKANSDMVTAP